MGIRGKALSREIREALVRCYEEGGFSYEQVANIFSVGRASVNRILNQYRRTGSVAAKAHGGGAARVLNPAQDKELLRIVQEHNDWTSLELTAELCKRLKIQVSRSTVDKRLRQAGYSRKKKPYGPVSEPFPGFSSGVLTIPKPSDASGSTALFFWTRPVSTRR